MYAVNRYGVKSKTITIPFTKEPHFWQLWWVRAAAFIAFVVLVWLIIRSSVRKVKKTANEKIAHERQIHELEQMALRAQMNPHFIFNCLNSVQQYIFSGNVAEANAFITNFSSLIRQTLYISGKKFITVDEEIKYLNSYLEIEQSKYENIFDFTIQKSETGEIEDIPIPPLLLQPYIENSIRHGVLNLTGARGLIEICFSLKNEQLYCVVKDNGIGREASMALKQKLTPGHKSKGLELAQNRIESLNSIYNIFINVSIDDINTSDERGTVVTIKFPLSYGE
jgi:LytS/YehU family sensor histidine kinase